MLFKNTGEDFSGYNAACAWARANGYSVGSMQRGAPTAMFKGDCLVSKWRNLRKEDLKAMDGKIVALGEFKTDDCVVELRGSDTFLRD